MKYLHTMVRVRDLDASLDFYCNKLGLVEASRFDNPAGRFTLVFLCAPDDLERAKDERTPTVELTFNWDTEDYQGGRNFGHLAYQVEDVYAACARLRSGGVTINRPLGENDIRSECIKQLFHFGIFVFIQNCITVDLAEYPKQMLFVSQGHVI